MTCAENYGCASVAIPAISSGIFKFPKKLCAKVLFLAVQNFAKENTECSYLKLVKFTNIDNETSDIFKYEFYMRYILGKVTPE